MESWYVVAAVVVLLVLVVWALAPRSAKPSPQETQGGGAQGSESYVNRAAEKTARLLREAVSEGPVPTTARGEALKVHLERALGGVAPQYATLSKVNPQGAPRILYDSLTGADVSVLSAWKGEKDPWMDHAIGKLHGAHRSLRLLGVGLGAE